MLFASPPAQETAARGQLSPPGERAVGRQLAALDALLESCVSPGDCVDRATHSGEPILVMRGIASNAHLPQLAERLAQFEADSGLRIPWSSATSTSAGERIEAVFLRADDALSALKDRAMATRGIEGTHAPVLRSFSPRSRVSQ